MKTKIYVNRHIVAQNKRSGECAPPLALRTGKKVRYAHDALITGASRLVYRPDKPLSCGATIWIETESEVLIEN